MLGLCSLPTRALISITLHPLAANSCLALLYTNFYAIFPKTDRDAIN